MNERERRRQHRFEICHMMANESMASWNNLPCVLWQSVIEWTWAPPTGRVIVPVCSPMSLLKVNKTKFLTEPSGTTFLQLPDRWVNRCRKQNTRTGSTLVLWQGWWTTGVSMIHLVFGHPISFQEQHRWSDWLSWDALGQHGINPQCKDSVLKAEDKPVLVGGGMDGASVNVGVHNGMKEQMQATPPWLFWMLVFSPPTRVDWRRCISKLTLHWNKWNASFTVLLVQ